MIDYGKKTNNNFSKFPKERRMGTFDKFKKLNSVMLPPKRTSAPVEDSYNPEDKYMNTTIFRQPIVKNLSTICKFYSGEFDKVCDDVIQAKYKMIFQEIYNFSLLIKHSNDKYVQTLVLNTDQNSQSFFEQLQTFLSQKLTEPIIINKGERHFKDVKNLFVDLKLEDDYSSVESSSNRAVRFIIIGEIQKLDRINLNLFLKRIVEYNQDVNKPFINLLIFDVNYDIRSLFDAIRPNVLTYFVFNTLDNIPSKTIYKEVLYKYLYENKRGIFTPNPNHIKMIINYVNNHQISIKSFKHQFRYLIFEFFFMQNWEDDGYLIYHPDSDQVNVGDDLEYERRIKKFFNKKLIEIYGVHSKELIKSADSESLAKKYSIKAADLEIFFHLYKFCEDFASEINHTKGVLFDKFQFFFDFLQFGKDQEIAINNRVDIIMTHIKLTPFDEQVQLIQNIILPIYSKSIREIKDATCYPQLKLMKKEMKKITSEGNAYDLKKGTVRKVKIEKDDPLLKSGQEVQLELQKWLKNLLSYEIFEVFYDFENDLKGKFKNSKRIWANCYTKYGQFHQIVNPSLTHTLMEDLVATVKIDNRNYLEFLKHFLTVYGRLGSEFRLKVFFFQVLSLSGVNNQDSSTAKLFKLYFMHYCYYLSVIGLISQKNSKCEIMKKTYYQITNYYTKK